MPTVGGNQVSAFTDPQNGQTADASQVLSNDNTTRAAHNAHDADATIHVQSSAVASRPAAGTAGRVWVSTDSDVPRVWVDTGATWVEIDYLNKTQGGTVAAATTFSDDVTVSGELTPSGGLSGAVTLNDASARIVGGGTTTTFRNAANDTNNVIISDNGLVTVDRQAVVAPEFRATATIGTGQAGAVTLTGYDNTGSVNASGVGTIKFKDGTSRDSVGLLRVLVGTTNYYVPFFDGGG